MADVRAWPDNLLQVQYPVARWTTDPIDRLLQPCSLTIKELRTWGFVKVSAARPNGDGNETSHARLGRHGNRQVPTI